VALFAKILIAVVNKKDAKGRELTKNFKIHYLLNVYDHFFA